MDKLQPPEGDEYPFILIGNKNDRIEFPFVNEEDIKEYCSSHYNMPYFSCSAKSGKNVEKAFTKIAELALNRVNKKKIDASDQIKYIKLNTHKLNNKNQEKKPEDNKAQNKENKENKKFCCF